MNQTKEQQTLTVTFAHGTDAQSTTKIAPQVDAHTNSYAGMMGYPYNVQVCSKHQKV